MVAQRAVSHTPVSCSASAVTRPAHKGAHVHLEGYGLVPLRAWRYGVQASACTLHDIRFYTGHSACMQGS